MTATPTRLAYVDGVWLLSADLRDQAALRARRLAQHHVAAHRTWGVSAGLAVSVRDLELIVTHGFGVDRCGRVGMVSRTSRIALSRALLATGGATVVLSVRGDGPAARIGLVALGEALTDRDVPLARLDAEGTVHVGDGSRQWLRRPGPARTLGGIVPAGSAVSAGSTPLNWTVHVDLASARLSACPAVVAGLIGNGPASIVLTSSLELTGGTYTESLTAPVSRSTVDVGSESREGFDLTVRHHVPPGTQLLSGLSDPITPDVRVTPVGVSWVVLAPARRPTPDRYPPSGRRRELS